MTSIRYSPGATRQFSPTQSWTLVGVDPGLLTASHGGSAETNDLGDLREELVEQEEEEEESSSLTSDL